MPFAPRLQHLGIDALAVVAHQEPEVARRVFEFHLNTRRARVAKCIDECLPADPVHFIAQDRVQRTRLSIHNDSIANVLLDARRMLFRDPEIPFGTSVILQQRGAPRL